MKRLTAIFTFLFKKNPIPTGLFFLFLLISYIFCLPNPLFQDPVSNVMDDKDGNLLGAKIAADGQWRFPHNDYVPKKFETAIIAFEDQRFFSHFGIDPRSIARAIQQNIEAGRVVSGGSTISMQVMRMARKANSRSFFHKLIETIQATRLELKYSKKEILSIYASNAPFGGNVVGLDAACWRYFGKQSDQLSWAEAATLAVLPNSPALIHPGKNQERLLTKRNRLLTKLLENGSIDRSTHSLALEETLPQKPYPLPRLAPHFMQRVIKAQKENAPYSRLRTTIDRNLQERTNNILSMHHKHLSANQINNAAVVILEIESGDVLAYVGNIPNLAQSYQPDVDVVKAPRSTGSILKPLLYAMMLNNGELLPSSLVVDVPTNIRNYQPENYNQDYEGLVPADQALSRSLNVPMVRMLQDYGLQKFHFGLKQLGLSTLNKSPDHYGLPLILGGAETTLWDITNTYACMARTLNHFTHEDGLYDPYDFRLPNYISGKPIPKSTRKEYLTEAPKLSAASIWFAFRAMEKLERPNSQGDWQKFYSSKRIAWKTGTSFGFRDAWAIGLNSRYAVGVWVGNADGEGRPGLIGVHAAAPILFDVFELLPDAAAWFEKPFDELRKIEVCKKSGFRAKEMCEKDSMWVPLTGLGFSNCPYHKNIHLDQSGNWQVNADCESTNAFNTKPWFVLAPIEAFYYKSKNAEYADPPSFREDCKTDLADNQVMQMIYPTYQAKILVPRGLDGRLSRTVFKVAHRKPESTIHWHINNTYLGSTQNFHHFELNPTAGKHVLTIVDEKGNNLEQRFEIAEQRTE